MVPKGSKEISIEIASDKPLGAQLNPVVLIDSVIVLKGVLLLLQCSCMERGMAYEAMRMRQTSKRQQDSYPDPSLTGAPIVGGALTFNTF